MKTIELGVALIICALWMPAVSAFNWSGWTYLGDDGVNNMDNAFMDIRHYGYKIENGIWWFRAEYNSSYPSERPDPFYLQFVKIDTKPGGEPGTGADYKLEHLVGHGIATYKWIGTYWVCIRDMSETPFDLGDNWWIVGIRISDLDVQQETVDFWWTTEIHTDDERIDIDTTNRNPISGSEVSIGMFGLLILSLLLTIPFLVIIEKGKKK